jgi:uncharacterized membrane protein
LLSMPALVPLVAHAGPGVDHAGEIALAAVAIAAMVIPLIVLGFMGRVFWRAAKRDEEAARSSEPPRGAADPR